MSTYALYDSTTGQILGVTGGTMVPSPPATNQNYLQIDPTYVVNIDQYFIQMVSGQPGLVQKTSLTLADQTLLLGATPTISLPSDCWTTLDGQSKIQGPRTLPSTLTAGTHTLVALGKYRGTATLTVVSLAAYQTQLCTQIDATRESLQMANMTEGGIKKMMYMAKFQEQQDYLKAGSAAIALLDLTTRRARFPVTFAEVDISGDTLAVVQARFSAGVSATMARIYRLEAISQLAKRNIRAATTLAGALSAYNAVDWTK